MRLLVVEDSPDWLAILVERLQAIPGVTVTAARSRDSALSLLNDGWFDLIICDLKIPTSDGQLDVEKEHGEAVIARAQESHPGTPLMILSAFGTQDFALGITESAAKLDIIGDGAADSLATYRSK